MTPMRRFRVELVAVVAAHLEGVQPRQPAEVGRQLLLSWRSGALDQHRNYAYPASKGRPDLEPHVVIGLV
jgi:hypothetical protein